MCACMFMGLFRLQVRPDSTFLAWMKPAEDVMGFIIFLLLLDFLFLFLFSILHFEQACRYGHVQHLEHLLFYGADMTAQNASGNTALHICALYNQVHLCDLGHENKKV